MVKMKIGNKLIITYFIILIMAFSLTGIFFNYLSKIYLIREAKEQLKIEGEKIAETLRVLELEESTVREKLLSRQQLKIAERFIDSEILVLNKNRKVIYKDLKNIDPRTLLHLTRRDNEKIKGYVFRSTPIVSDNGEIKGYVLLFTKIKNINELNKLLRRTQLLSFFIAGILAFIIGLFFTRSLTGPIKELSKRMKGFTLKNYNEYKLIKTGDEIEELDKSFREMARKIKNYDEMQKRFFQNTSHELKTPLMSIQGYAEAIKDGIVEGKEMEEGLNIIINESQRLKKIVDELVYLSKLENVEESYSFKKVSLNEIIHNSVKTVKSLADERNLKINIEEEINYNGLFDEDKLLRALINLLGNAIRYAESEITIKILDKIDNIEIQIRDDGAGFKNGEEYKVFDRFYKGYKGNTGIGLAITKAIIEGHKGKITAHNNIPKGAVLKIELPKGS